MHPESPLRPGTVFERIRDLDDLPADLRLPNAAWAVLFAVTGEHTAAQIGDHCGLAESRRDQAFQQLVDEGLIAERLVTAGEYLRAAATVADETPHDLAGFLASVARPSTRGVVVRRPEPRTSATADDAQPVESRVERPVPPVSVPRPVVPSTPPPAASDAHTTRRIRTAEVAEMLAVADQAPEVGFEPLNEPTGSVPTAPEPIHTEPTNPAAEPEANGERRLSLRSLMQFILDRAPDLNAGQLDVYRVFIRVDTKLLKRNGITTLRFEEDRLVGDAELQHAIRSSLERTLGLTMPQTVYVN